MLLVLWLEVKSKSKPKSRICLQPPDFWTAIEALSLSKPMSKRTSRSEEVMTESGYQILQEDVVEVAKEKYENFRRDLYVVAESYCFGEC